MSALDRAAERDIPVVLLAVGGTPAGTSLVSAHSGALAGSDAAWEVWTVKGTRTLGIEVQRILR